MLVIMSLAVVNRDIHCSSLAIFSSCLENVIIKSCKHIGVGELRAQCVFHSITPPPKQKIECQSPWKATPPLTRGSVFQSSAARHSDTAHPFAADVIPCQVTTSANCPKLPQGWTGFQKELVSFTGANYIPAIFSNRKLEHL